MICAFCEGRFHELLEMKTYERGSCLCGFHVYYTIWHVVNGEELMCEREPSNRKDIRYAVAVIKDGDIKS